jgi:RecA/RadA recombinase
MEMPMSQLVSLLPVELAALKDQFISASELQPPPGVQTGIAVIDDFLLWQGIPKGDLSLFQGSPGTGATSLWVSMTQKVHEENKWVAWVNAGTQLLPTHLVSRKINLKKLLVVQEPSEKEQLFWLLQEMISSSLFEVIGCQIKEMFFKNHQLQKLKRLCRLHKVALVFINQKPLRFINPLFSLSILFQRDFVTIQRALHRPTPFNVAGSMIHANFMHQFKNTARKLIS